VSLLTSIITSDMRETFELSFPEGGSILEEILERGEGEGVAAVAIVRDWANRRPF
jgi:hypothetical protein